MMAKSTMGWSAYLNAMQFDYDRFEKCDAIAAHVREHMATPV